ncbi:MAG: MoaD/ThiS family protein [Polyangiales bacterium]
MSRVSRVRVLAFAGAREAMEGGEHWVPLPAPTSAAAFLTQLCEAFPLLAPHASSLRLAVNGSYANAGDTVSPGDEVAVIPPVAGG